MLLTVTVPGACHHPDRGSAALDHRPAAGVDVPGFRDWNAAGCSHRVDAVPARAAFPGAPTARLFFDPVLPARARARVRAGGDPSVLSAFGGILGERDTEPEPALRA